MITKNCQKKKFLRFMKKYIIYISNYFFVYDLINKERTLSRLHTVATRLAQRLRTVREKVSQHPYCHVVVWTCKGLLIALARKGTATLAIAALREKQLWSSDATARWKSSW